MRLLLLLGFLIPSFQLGLIPKACADSTPELAAKIESVINRPEYHSSDWGILIVDSTTGEALYVHNADRLFLPASTTKLYSCTAALVAFGANHRFQTPVYARGDIKDGKLQGDLILVAQGDLTMGGRDDGHGHMAFKNNDHTYAGGSSPSELTDTDQLAGLRDLSRQVKAAGIRQISGDVRVDDRLFTHARGSGSGPDMLTPIVINDNVIDIQASPAAEAGKPASILVRPQTAYIQVDAHMDTVPKGQPTRWEIRSAGPRAIAVRGQIAVGHKPLLGIAPVSDPASFARALFLEALQREEVQVQASPLQEPAINLPEPESYSKLKRIAVHTSLPLSEVLKVTLKVSHNLYASTLPLLLAAKENERTLAKGLHIQRRILASLGLDVSAISFGGGAGGSNADHVTPRASVQLLQILAKKPDLKAIFDGMPVMGVDGTLAESVPADSPAKGKVAGKTGTLTWADLMNDRTILTSKALAGVMTTAKGRKLTFAIYVNKVPLPKGVTSTREGKAIGEICELIYSHAP